MVVLTGKNLGERHRELNYKVAEVMKNNKNFDDIKNEHEVTVVDKIYKIDVASQYRNVDYIVEVLKSGDSLYISRALKCRWLYDDSYSHVINVENLHNNIFPCVSIKMKNRMLVSMSMHVRNNERAAIFHNYCKNNGMTKIALKFLCLTSEDYKLKHLKNYKVTKQYYLADEKSVRNFIGNSFELATEYMEKEKHMFGCYKPLHFLRYLYTVNNEKYLDLLEKYEMDDVDSLELLNQLGIRISRDVMIKNKNRVLKYPAYYLRKINKSMLVKYSSECDAKKYITSLMPSCAKKFWEIDFYKSFNCILDLIPINEKFEFMRQLFTTKYPGEPFEKTVEFYDQEYYNMFSIDQREIWALRHIEDQKEILGIDNDYIWYKFVNVDKALFDIKKLICITTDPDKRSNLINTLVESARDQKDLIKVLNYYIERHMNENSDNKESFIDMLLNVHNVFDFNIECWEALNKIFYSLDIYIEGRYIPNKVFVAVAVASHILHNKDMPQALKAFIDVDINYTYFKLILEKLGKENSEIVFQHLLNFSVEKLQPFDQDPHNERLRKKLKKYVNNIYNLMTCFQKSDDECPEIVKKFMNIHSPKPSETKKVTAKDIFSYIKTDATMALDVLSHFDRNIDDWPGTSRNPLFSISLRKLKVYFQNDVAQEYVKFLHRWIPNFPNNYNGHRLVSSAFFALFQLAEESLKITLMEKYYPSETRIDYSKRDDNLLHIQEAICKFVGYSQPPVPLEYVLKYIKGDYVHYCLPIFNMYLANLPLPRLIKFTEAILDMPLSIQKHGLRLAFDCFDDENLKTILLSIWKKTKNVSLRKKVYILLFQKISQNGSEEGTGEQLYEAFKFFTADLNENDDEDLFRVISHRVNRIPSQYINDYLKTTWYMVTKLPTKRTNIIRQTDVIKNIEKNINLVEKEFVKCVVEEHVNEMLEQGQLKPTGAREIENLRDAKWRLTTYYLVRFKNNAEMEQCLALMKRIFRLCRKMWAEQYGDSLIYQELFFQFVPHLQHASLMLWFDNIKHLSNVPIFQIILDMIQEELPFKKTYLVVWSLKLTIFSKISIYDTNIINRRESLKRLSVEELKMISDKLANQIEDYINELLAKNKFYSVLLQGIAELIKAELVSLAMILSVSNDFYIIFCESLVSVGKEEAHLLSVMILSAFQIPKKKIRKLIDKIRAFPNDEVQCYVSTIYGHSSNTKQLLFA